LLVAFQHEILPGEDYLLFLVEWITLEGIGLHYCWSGKGVGLNGGWGGGEEEVEEVLRTKNMWWKGKHGLNE
jgi:hypothetical protein